MKMGNVLILSGSPNYALLGDFKGICMLVLFNQKNVSNLFQKAPSRNLPNEPKCMTIFSFCFCSPGQIPKIDQTFRFCSTDDCISNPTLCTNGLSVAMWIKFEAGGFIMSSGAQSNLATGFSLSFESAAFRLRLSTNTKEYQMSISSVSTDWFQFAFTWNEKAGLAYYENGILVTKVIVSNTILIEIFFICN